MPGLAEHGTAGAYSTTSSPRAEKSGSSPEETCSDVIQETLWESMWKQSHLSEDVDVSQGKRKRKRPVRPVTHVEPGSIYHVMHQHAGTSLFIRPIAWTDEHSKCLGAVWTDFPRIEQPIPATSCTTSPRPDSERKFSKEATDLVRELNCIFAPGAALPFYSVFPIRNVLQKLYPGSGLSAEGISTPELHMWFGGRAYRDAVRVQCLWTWPYPAGDGAAGSSASSQTASQATNRAAPSSFVTETTEPATSFAGAAAAASDPRCGRAMVAYLGRKQLASIRSHLFRVVQGPLRTANEPVLRLQARRCEMLMPENADHDAHLVGIMIAMAQHHAYPQYRDAHFSKSGVSRVPLAAEPDFRDVTVRILTNDNDAADFVVYKATVTADYLRRLHYPTRSIVEPLAAAAGEDRSRIRLPSLDIDVTRVATWPVLGLKERLGRALGEDVVGPFDVDKPEMWRLESSSEQPGSPADGENKRGRDEVASSLPVFDGSFNEEEAAPSRSSKRQRLGESGGPVEVVI